MKFIGTVIVEPAPPGATKWRFRAPPTMHAATFADNPEFCATLAPETSPLGDT
jgi:hypothetical protein